MRELQVCPPTKHKPIEVVRRLEFRASGAELVAWCGSEAATKDGRTGFTNKLHVYDCVAGSARELFAGWFFYESSDERTPDPVISPNRELIAFEDTVAGTHIYFEGLTDAAGETPSFPSLPGGPRGAGGLAFTRDGTELIAVRNLMEGGAFAPDVVRFTIASLFKVLGTEEKINPLNGKPYQKRIYDVRWQESLTLPPGERLVTACLSADDRLLVVGGNEGVLHVADLEQKKVLASFPWEGRKLRDRSAVRVAFSPDAKWVVMLANGRLFARPLGEGKAWQTKSTLGYAHDFAFHPAGRTLCAVFADGRARVLDALTGNVLQSFQWGKKPLYSVAFAPDGLTCAAGGPNGRVVVWDIDG
ncbi:wd40 repeat-containing protein : Putative vegetative incompatibility protein het-e-1 protein OS=Botryotinia fuckeliana (strain BcDW1) GN=BcDW1_1632 PE=4 SV=1: WD40 [Gemmata massiliana]|uniref:Anaphase-promoting complex subunit 4-like WD40 domain-containing protein n=1 Tax=Gemmata massiliana TaxID=1210884 RepID=A0A6P2CYC2_9BACT|nr:WD40 repeat domain-containing protein [Gemmata massiliana]VTR92200.1 wd40 repeat-containing protein : Putative vegetative incompatibility protein het-e-1 protein OS=Botryotinia fuckeliana (strain BcDW1) GN=BcDW1_1632 PE=4 SV=1: WD40 [Gemmata massiliana]